MKTLNVMLSNLGGRVVPIGYEGENLYTRIRINCIEVFADYPDATVSMVVNSPVGQMYPAVIEKSGVMVIWDITDAVLSSNGSGECQLTFTDGDVVRKSVVFGISINRSLIASGDPPEPVQEWIDKADQTAQEIAENAANLAKEDIVESYGSIAPAIIETASGAIASFSDGADGMLVKTLTVDIDPVQDIHGYDSPWPGGGGKNLVDTSSGEMNKWTNADGSVISLNAGWMSEYIIIHTSEYIASVQDGMYLRSWSIVFYDTNKTFISRNHSSYSSGGTLSTGVIPSEAVYMRVQVSTQSDSTMDSNILNGYKLQFEAGSTATSYSPYSNICPIYGWDSADVTRTGKNLFDGAELGSINQTTGQNAYSNSAYRTINHISVNPGNPYTISGLLTATGQVRMFYYDAEKGYLSNELLTASNSVITKTVGSNVHFIRFQANEAVFTNETPIQCEAGSSASEYESYQGTTYTYTFPQSAGTVYGGTLTIHQDGTGTLVVDRGMWTIDGTEANWEYTTASSGRRFRISVANIPGMAESGNADTVKSDKFIWADSSNATWGHVRLMSQYLNFTDNNSVFDGLASFKTWLSNNNTQVLAPIASSVSYELTAQQVALLKGVNNVWADTGDVSLEYPADTKLYIDARVAELQALILENISNS